VFRFFEKHAYRGYFIAGGHAYSVDGFDPARLQDPDALCRTANASPAGLM